MKYQISNKLEELIEFFDTHDMWDWEQIYPVEFDVQLRRNNMGEILLVMDMVNDFLDPDGALYCGEEAREIITPIVGKIGETRNNGGRIIFVNDSHDSDDEEFDRFPPHCVASTPGANVIPELEGMADTMVHKDGFDATATSELHVKLRGRIRDFTLTSNEALDEYILVGVCTDICILHTVIGLSKWTNNITVMGNMVSSYNMEAHKWALDHMENILGINVV